MKFSIPYWVNYQVAAELLQMTHRKGSTFSRSHSILIRTNIMLFPYLIFSEMSSASYRKETHGTSDICADVKSTTRSQEFRINNQWCTYFLLVSKLDRSDNPPECIRADINFSTCIRMESFLTSSYEWKLWNIKPYIADYRESMHFFSTLFCSRSSECYSACIIVVNIKIRE